MRAWRNLSFFFALDVAIIWVSIFFAYNMRFENGIPDAYLEQHLYFSVTSMIICALFMFGFKLYNRVWKYASMEELSLIVSAVIFSAFITYIITYSISGKVIPMPVFLLSYETTLILLGGSRYSWKIYQSMVKRKSHVESRNTLIIGAGDCGRLIVQELKRSTHSLMKPVAFIDDNVNKHKMRVCGLPVLGGKEKINAIVELMGIQDIIIAMPSAPKQIISELIDICKSNRAKLKIIPSIEKLIDGKIILNEIRDVEVEDLLGRDPINVDLDQVARYLTNEIVLVTGAGGSIGSELCRQISKFLPSQLLLLGNYENDIFHIENELKGIWPELHMISIIADIRDTRRIDQIFAQYRPSVVFHAAAHKHVPLMENNPSEAIKTNIFGTKNVADSAHKYGTSKFVLISTDKAVNPTSVMGTSKRIAELYVKAKNSMSDTRFSVVRFGNVLGSRGSVVPKFKEQIAAGGPVTVTHPDMIRFFMTIPEAVQLIIQAGALSNGGEIFVLDMGEPVRILSLAEDLIRLSGFDPYVDIPIAYTGIRPGEKLFEELLSDEEQLITTKNQRIFVTKSLSIPMIQLESELISLELTSIENGDHIRENLNRVLSDLKEIQLVQIT